MKPESIINIREYKKDKSLFLLKTFVEKDIFLARDGLKGPLFYRKQNAIIANGNRIMAKYSNEHSPNGSSPVLPDWRDTNYVL